MSDNFWDMVGVGGLRVKVGEDGGGAEFPDRGIMQTKVIEKIG